MNNSCNVIVMIMVVALVLSDKPEGNLLIHAYVHRYTYINIIIIHALTD